MQIISRVCFISNNMYLASLYGNFEAWLSWTLDVPCSPVQLIYELTWCFLASFSSMPSYISYKLGRKAVYTKEVLLSRQQGCYCRTVTYIESLKQQSLSKCPRIDNFNTAVIPDRALTVIMTRYDTFQIHQVAAQSLTTELCVKRWSAFLK